MKTIDQAFVQAFARRNRSSQRADQTSKHANTPAPVTIHTDNGELRVDPAETDTLHAEADTSLGVPTPHFADDPAAIDEQAAIEASIATTAAQAMATETMAQSTAQPTSPPKPITEAPADEAVDVVRQRFDQPGPVSPAGKPQTKDDAPHASETEASSTETLRAEPLSDETPVAETPAAEFSAAEVHVAAPIQPIWEVDRFDVPRSVSDLFFEESLFESIAKRLHEAADSGLQSMMVTSVQTGEGRSTVAIGMAMAAAAAGLNVALIDGDVDEPTLFNDLRLDVDFGWLDTLRGGLPVDQIAVYSIEDNLTLIPVMPASSAGTAATEHEVEQLIDSLQGRFDLLIVDAPSGDTTLVDKFAGLVDSAVIARDVTRTDNETINELSQRLQASGVEGVGLVDNFC